MAVVANITYTWLANLLNSHMGEEQSGNGKTCLWGDKGDVSPGIGNEHQLELTRKEIWKRETNRALSTLNLKGWLCQQFSCN